MASQTDASEQDWQVTCTQMKERGAHLLRSGLWTDCTFLVGPKRVAVEAHRLILAMASPFFAAMFYGPNAENKSSTLIEDVTPEIFQYLLDYMYTDEIKINSFSDAWELLPVAHRYMVHHVAKECIEFMSSNLSPQNACRAYELACLYDEDELMEDALKVMSTETKEVLANDYFEEAELSTVVKLFSLDDLSIDSEIELLDAAERYAKRHENTIQNLEKPEKLSIRNVVQQIRFLTLTADQFAAKETALLKDSEAYAIIKNISSKNTQLPMPQGFSTNREMRNGLWSNSQLLATCSIEFSVNISFKDTPVTRSDSLHIGTHMRDMLCYFEVNRDWNINDTLVEVKFCYDYDENYPKLKSSYIFLFETTFFVIDENDNRTQKVSKPILVSNKHSSCYKIADFKLREISRFCDDTVTVEVRVHSFQTKQDAEIARTRYTSIQSRRLAKSRSFQYIV